MRPLVVAVNLSALQITQPGLSATVSAAFERHALPALLELEITESVLMRDTDRALKVLSELRQIGIKVSIDDFGTGYSSLNYLKRLPLDKLKIDQSFIRDLPRTPTMWRLRKPSLPSAQNSAWPSLPRGRDPGAIRVPAQQRLQPDSGFYFSRPRPPAEIIDEFRAHRRDRFPCRKSVFQ
jgi:EAL domain-containing protein (putative c-di-GMP-specific phosphodiesterase class I)